MSAAPSFSAQAHDWGHPQLRSTPFTLGATRDDARASSRGTLAPNWTIVGGWLGFVETVRSLTLLAYVVLLKEYVQTAVSRKAVAIKLLGQDHRRPA